MIGLTQKEKPQTIAGSDFLRKFEITTNQFTMTNLHESNEVWKDIPGHEGKFQVSNLARVKGLERYVHNRAGIYAPVKERILNITLDKGGYQIIGLNENNKTLKRRVHRLVALAFIPNPENKPYINHINGNPADNRIENLEWCTQKENMIHAFHVLKRGRKKRNRELYAVLDYFPKYSNLPIVQFSPRMKFKQRFESIKELDKKLNLNSFRVFMALVNGKPSSQKHIWKFESGQNT